MSSTRIFVFCRPYLIPDFRENVAALGNGFEFRFLTDGQSEGTTDTRARFYARLSQAPQPAGFDAAAEQEVIDRCRFLRNLAPDQALRMLRAMASVLSEELDQHAPVAVLSHMVDDYVTHLLAELARRRGLVYVGFAYSYFPGKVQVTEYGYGLPFNFREPDDAETTEVQGQISDRTFRQNYLQKDTYTRVRHLKAMLRYRVKQVVFAARARLQRDPLHMHYACLPFVVERRRWSDFPSPNDFHGDWRARLEATRQGAAKPVLYFPLGYFPEATIDYWIGNRRALQYERTVLDICRTLAPHFTVVVKEHLHMLGARSTAFYRQIRDLPQVISVPPLEYSNDVLAAADTVLMGAGSIGVEAYIRGKAIVSFCDTSYWFPYANALHVDLDDLGQWPQRIAQKIAGHVEPTPQQRLEFIRQCLRSTMRQLRPGKRWPICNPQDLAQALATAAARRTAPAAPARPAEQTAIASREAA